jgi:SdpI/YfhL protein family
MEALFWLYLISGVLLMALSVPLVWRKVPPNGIYGFRVSKSLNNPQVWYEVNAYSGKRLFWTGLMTVIASVALYQVPGISIDSYALGVLAVFLVVITVGLLQSMKYLRSL